MKFLILILISTMTFTGTAHAATKPTNNAFVPMVELDFWNIDTKRQWNNNCYNYATNRVTNSFAQPGEASKNEYEDLTCVDVYSAASSDLGLVPTPFFEHKGKNDDTLIALVVSPNYDYHWYRRDDNGEWTHKMGGTPATEKDDNDKKIISPETADRGSYTEFCGYFRIQNLDADKSEQNAGYVRIGNMKTMPKLRTEKDQNEKEKEKEPQPLPINIASMGAASPAPAVIEKSTVQVMKFSGRRDPQMDLVAMMAKPAFRKTLGEVHEIMSAQKTSSSVNEPRIADLMRKFEKLGYRGILIDDVQGLMFPAGSRVMFQGTDMLLTLPGEKPQVVHIDNARVGDLEKQVLAEF